MIFKYEAIGMKICHNTEHKLCQRWICGQIQDLLYFSEAIKELVRSTQWVQHLPKITVIAVSLFFQDKQHFLIKQKFKMAAEIW